MLSGHKYQCICCGLTNVVYYAAVIINLQMEL